MNYYHGIMFDFDGTLIDTMHNYATIASQEISRIYNISINTARQLYLETSGIPFFQQLIAIFGEDERNPKCAYEFENRKANYLQNMRLSTGVHDLIVKIRSMGISIAITSNNYQELLDRFIQKEPDLFDLVLGFGNGLSKGTTQFSYVMDTFGVDRRHLLFIGDSLTDVRKSLAFGVDFVAVSGTLKAESFTSLFPSVSVISNLNELIPILNREEPIEFR